MWIRPQYILLSVLVTVIIGSAAVPVAGQGGYFHGPFADIPGESWGRNDIPATVIGAGYCRSFFLPIQGTFTVNVTAHYTCNNGNSVKNQAQIGPIDPYLYIKLYGYSWTEFGSYLVMETITPAQATCDIFASTHLQPAVMETYPANCTPPLCRPAGESRAEGDMRPECGGGGGGGEPQPGQSYCSGAYMGTDYYYYDGPYAYYAYTVYEYSTYCESLLH